MDTSASPRWPLIGREVTWQLGIRVAEHGKAESPSGTPNLLEWSGASLDQLREGPEEMDRSGQAVVLGGGVAGMLAARVLADTFEQVTIIERQPTTLPAVWTPGRRVIGVPSGQWCLRHSRNGHDLSWNDSSPRASYSAELTAPMALVDGMPRR